MSWIVMHRKHFDDCYQLQWWEGGICLCSEKNSRGDSAGTELREADYLGYLAIQRTQKTLGCSSTIVLRVFATEIASQLPNFWTTGLQNFFQPLRKDSLSICYISDTVLHVKWIRSQVFSLFQKSVNFFCKKPDSKCFRICGPCSLCDHHSTLNIVQKQP